MVFGIHSQRNTVKELEKSIVTLYNLCTDRYVYFEKIFPRAILRYNLRRKDLRLFTACLYFSHLYNLSVLYVDRGYTEHVMKIFCAAILVYTFCIGITYLAWTW